MPRMWFFVDVDFQTGKCYLDGVELEEQAFAFDHYAIIQESIKRIQGRLDWNPTFLYLLEEEFTVYEGLNWLISSTLVAQLSAITFS